jgi:uncharacterized protein (TIGR03083 family)
MTRHEVVDGLFAEYEAFAELVEFLIPEDWNLSTRCEGWRVRDVAGHVLGSTVDVGTQQIGNRSPDEQAQAYRELEPSALAAALRAAVGLLRSAFEGIDESGWAKPGPLPEQSIGDAVLTLWHDTVVHGDDVRTALGRPSSRGAGLAAAVACVVAKLRRNGWGPARLALDGMAEMAIGDGGPVLRGDAWQFVLAATGRADPAQFGVDDRVNVYR